MTTLQPKGTGVPDYQVRGQNVTLVGTVGRLRRVNAIGSLPGTLSRVSYIPRIGTMPNMGTIQRVGYVGRLGTTPGTIPRVAYVARTGTGPGTLSRVSYVARTGTVPGTIQRVSYVARTGTVPGTLQRVIYVARTGTVPGTLSRISYVPRIGTLRGTIQRVAYVARTGTVPGTIQRVNYVGRLGTVGQREFGGTAMWNNRHTAVGSTYVGSWQYIAPYYMKTISVLSSLAGSIFVVVGATGTGPTRNTGTLNRTDLGGGSFASLSFTEHYQYVRTIVRTGSVGSGKGSLSVSVLRQV